MYEYTYNVSKLIEEFGNEFAATMYVAQQTRKILTQSNNALTESEAINWILSRKPDSELQDYIEQCKPRVKLRKYNLLNEYASQIDDKELEMCFRDSAIESINAHKLLVSYRNLDSADCVRLRILLKQFWLDYLQNEIPDYKLHLS